MLSSLHSPASQPAANRRKIKSIPVWGTEPKSIALPFCPVTALRQRLDQLPTNQVEIALRLTQEHLQASGIRLYLQTNNATYHCGLQPKKLGDGSDRRVEQHLLWQQFLESGYLYQAGDTNLSSDRTWVIANLSDEFRLRTLATAFKQAEIEQVMVIPLRYAGQLLGCLSAFRDRTQPPWNLAQVVLAQQFGEEFAQVIYDHQLVHQVHQLSQAMMDRPDKVQEAELQQIIGRILKMWTAKSEFLTGQARPAIAAHA